MLAPQVQDEAAKLIIALRANAAEKSKIKGYKQMAVKEKNAVMKYLRHMRSNLGSIVRLNFRGTPLVAILEMKTRYKTVSGEGDEVVRKPRYDHREATERSHFRSVIDNLKDLPQEARRIMAGAGWTKQSNRELSHKFAEWEAICKRQNQLENDLAFLIDAGKTLLKEATRWYRNTRLAARGLRGRRPDLVSLIDLAFPGIDPPKKVKKSAPPTPDPKQQPQIDPPKTPEQVMDQKPVRSEASDPPAFDAQPQQIKDRTEETDSVEKSQSPDATVVMVLEQLEVLRTMLYSRFGSELVLSPTSSADDIVTSKQTLANDPPPVPGNGEPIKNKRKTRRGKRRRKSA